VRMELCKQRLSSLCRWGCLESQAKHPTVPRTGFKGRDEAVVVSHAHKSPGLTGINLTGFVLVSSQHLKRDGV